MRRSSPRASPFVRFFRRRGSSIDYHGVPESGSLASPLQTIRPRRHWRLCRGANFLVLVSLILLGSLFLFSLSASTKLRYGSGASDRVVPRGALSREALDALSPIYAKDDIGGEHRLRIFMPADSPHINLCKVIMSSVALGYPLPTLLNWNGEFNRPEWHFAGSHIAKLESLLAVIEELLLASAEDRVADENDLAVMVDAYDIWFQLPPSVLIQRYHQLNREADERVRLQWQAAQNQDQALDFPVPPPRQSIIVTSAKDCQPDSESGSQPNYAHWPDSPMPEDLYGEGTDQVLPLLFDPARKYKKIRPRCVNSGMIMGTLGSLRQALKRCKRKIEHVARSGRQLWSDQALFGEVIGDQEIWREWMRELGGRWNGKDAGYDLSLLSPEVRRIAEKTLIGKQFEFGIGLDYNFTTIPATCSSEEDGYFVKLNDKQAVEDESVKAGVPEGARVSSIPPELKDHDDEPRKGNDDPLSKVSWGNVPLYTDFYFGVTPVGIHHNAYINGLKSWRIQNWWSMTWFYPQLRELVSYHLQSLQNHTSLPLLQMPSTTQGKEGPVYLAAEAPQDRSKVTVFEPARGSEPAKFVPIAWDGVCQKGDTPWFEELFGDGKGPLEI